VHVGSVPHVDDDDDGKFWAMKISPENRRRDTDLYRPLRRATQAAAATITRRFVHILSCPKRRFVRRTREGGGVGGDYSAVTVSRSLTQTNPAK